MEGVETIGVSCGHRVPREPVVRDGRKLYWCAECAAHRMSGGKSTGERGHDWALQLRELVALEGSYGEPLAIVVDKPLTPHGQRLMDALGVEVRIVTQPVVARQMGSFIVDGLREPFVENLIDFRHSVVQAGKRADAGDETLEICAYCGCEVDVAPQPHRPGCEGIGKSRTTSAPVLAPRAVKRTDHEEDSSDEGAVDLDQEEGPRSPTPGSGVSDEEPPAMRAPTPEATDAAGEPELEPGPAPNRDPVNPYALQKFGRGYIWTKLAALQAVGDFAAEHGRPPRLADAKGATGALPARKSAEQLFESWDEMIERACFPRPKRGNPPASPAPSVRIAEEVAPLAHAEAELPELVEPAAEPEPDEPAHAESIRETPPLVDLTLGLTFEQLTAAGHALEAVSSQLRHLERDDRRAVWAFVQPLIEAALA